MLKESGQTKENHYKMPLVSMCFVATVSMCCAWLLRFIVLTGWDSNAEARGEEVYIVCVCVCFSM